MRIQKSFRTFKYAVDKKMCVCVRTSRRLMTKQITLRQFSVCDVILNGPLNDASSPGFSQRGEKKRRTKRIHFHFRCHRNQAKSSAYISMTCVTNGYNHKSAAASLFSFRENIQRRIYIIKINFLSAFLFVNHVAQKWPDF